MIETFNFPRSLPSMLVLFYGVCTNMFVKSLVFKPTFIHIIHTYILNVSRGTLLPNGFPPDNGCKFQVEISKNPIY